jgi:hypothetical protein
VRWIRFILYTKDVWSGVMLPIIRSVMPSISASEFVSVQPMSLPAGAVFYMDYKYGYIVIIWDEELWWEEDCNGNWVCPQTQDDHKINDHDWIKQRDERLVIPKWEVDQQEKHVGGIGNEQIKPFGQVPLDDSWFAPAGLPRGGRIAPGNLPVIISGRQSGKSRLFPIMKKYAK